MKPIMTLVFFAFFALNSQAQEGPYSGAGGNANLGQKIIHVIDNSTVGLIQTTVGAGHIIVHAILNPLKGGSPLADMGTHNSHSNEVWQFVMDEEPLFFPKGNYSLGLFQIGGYHVKHEGGHSVASASLGPLYLPTVALSYLVSNRHDSFLEDWADLESRGAPYYLTGDTQVGLGQVNWQGKWRHVAVFKFSLDQTQHIDRYGIKSHKILSWFNTKILAPFANDLRGDALPALVEVDLLSKKLNLVMENVDIYLGGDHELRQVIQTEQRYVSLRSNPALERMHLKALDWSAQYGLIYNLNENLSITPKVGITSAVEAFSNRRAFYNFTPRKMTEDLDWGLSAGIKGSVDFKAHDYLTLSLIRKRSWLTNDFFNDSFEVKVSNELRNPMKDFGFLHHLEGSASYRVEQWQTPSGYFKTSSWDLAVGIRF